MPTDHDYRRQLSTRLALADDLAFLQLMWALNALQTGRSDAAEKVLRAYPPDAAVDGILGPHAIYPWELETLINELLTVPKHFCYRIFGYSTWETVPDTLNLLRALENAEWAARRKEGDIFVEMGRIGARQFPWQRGYFNLPQLYRNAFIYGQGTCAAHLQAHTGLSVSDMTLVGFALISWFHSAPVLRPDKEMAKLHEWGLEPDTLRATIDLISRPLTDVRAAASRLRDVDGVMAYKPSILRQFPCFKVGHGRKKIIAPLPDLVMDRVTNGLYYDVVNGGGRVRDEIGSRFEQYSLALIQNSLRRSRFVGEETYPTRLGPIATPDIMMLDEAGAVELAIECKASRMTIAARFGEAPGEERGYEEIAKGVMQLWRYFAHCRRGSSPHHLGRGVQGMILTMDEWFAGRSTVIPQILERANVLADNSPHPIPADDRLPVAFCTISEMESVLRTATPESLQEAVRLGSGERAGWIFSILHDETEAEKTPPKDYPFREALGDLLPWYARLEDLREERD